MQKQRIINYLKTIPERDMIIEEFNKWWENYGIYYICSDVKPHAFEGWLASFWFYYKKNEEL